MEYTSDLPDDLLTDILVRLPVKSLLRFKCVIRNWYSLITSSLFVSNHLHRKENPTRLLIHMDDPDSFRSIATFMLPKKLSSGVTPVLEKPSCLQIPAMLNEIVGPVDGIFLLNGVLNSSNRIALWNPATREFRPLPPYVLELCQYRIANQVFGFGFDSLSCEYKVVYIVKVHWEGGGQDIDDPHVFQRVFAGVYSLSKDCWRNLTSLNLDTSARMYNSLCSTCVNGVYYWCTQSCSEVSLDPFETVQIAYFDMHTEVFGEIPGPDIRIYNVASLTLNKEFLCLLVEGYGNREHPPIDIWLMNGEKLWIKVQNVVPTSSVCCYPRGHEFCSHDQLIPARNGEDVLLSDSKTHEFIRLFYAGEERKRMWVFKLQGEPSFHQKKKCVAHARRCIGAHSTIL